MKSKILFAVVAALALLGLNASAQVDFTGSLGGSTISYATTNTTLSAPIGWYKGAEMAIQITTSGTNAGCGILTFVADESIDGVFYKSGTITLTSSACGATTNTTLTACTNLTGSKWVRFSEIRNTNALAHGQTVIKKFAILTK